MKKRLVLLDSFRALMPLLIMIFHMSWVFHDTYGISFLNMHLFEKTGGVDLFFVLSGFLMFYLYGERAGQDGAAGQFISRRLMRIIPFYALALIGSMIYYQTLSLEAFFSNILFVSESSIIGPAWSLSHTMFFYVLFTAYLKWPKLFRYLAIIYPLIVLTGMARPFIDVIGFPLLDFIFDPINVHFLIGIASAMLIKKYPFKHGLIPLAIGGVGYGLVWANYTYNWLPIDVTYYYGIFASLLLIGASSIDLKYDVRLPKFVILTANVSFAVYLLHEQLIHPVLGLTSQLGLSGYPTYILTMISIFLLCTGVHYLIERPLNKFVKNISEFKLVHPKVKASLSYLMVAIIGVGVVLLSPSAYEEDYIIWGEEDHDILIVLQSDQAHDLELESAYHHMILEEETFYQGVYHLQGEEDFFENDLNELLEYLEERDAYFEEVILIAPSEDQTIEALYEEVAQVL